MDDTILKKEGLTQTQKNLLTYFQTHDLKFIAEDAVFRNLSTGEVHTGRAEIGAMLHHMYQVAFSASLEVKNYTITEEKAAVEGIFKGRHIGELQGIPPTQKEVSVPLCVNYNLQNGLIKEARIYMLTEVLLKQLGITLNTALPKTAFIVRDVFQLKFGHFRDAKKLLEEALQKNMMPAANTRVLTDFTGDAYRLIFEEGFDHLGDYEQSLVKSMRTEEWQQWYGTFKPHVEKSSREILRQVF